MHKSVATLDNPEFINLEPLDINPLMSKCEIKVMYVGENRNGSFIDKDTATEISKTLRGCPIVGYYKKEKEDFADHGDIITIDDEGFHFECKTVPYGFVAPDAKIWFQKFDDTDDFGNVITREYLMTTGYLWAGQYPEVQSVVDEGKSQSMELDENSLDGHWARNDKTGMEFFIINDAIFSKLCILGDDVEPCFEGARVTAPEVSKNFTLDQEFKATLFSMMEDLKKIVQGGYTVENTEVITDPVVEDTPAPVDGEFVQSKEEETKDKEPETKEEEEKKKDDDDKYTLLESSYQELQDKYSKLQEEYSALNASIEALRGENEELKAFKLAKENEQKDKMIASFYMLSDEDKAEVIANKEKYTLDEIESKLSVICVRKKISFDLETEKRNVTTYNLDNLSSNNIPAWVQACEATKNSRK